MPAHAILGVQWGDEGKGKIVDYLASGYDVVARFQGGNNAGHTVVVGDRTFKLHLIPSGAVAGVPVAIGNGVVVDPRVLLSELEGLEAQGVRARLDVSPRAHVIMPYHVLLDGAAEESAKDTTIGTTRRGIGPCYTDKAARRGVRVMDLLSEKRLRSRLQAVWPAKRRELESWGVRVPSVARMVRDYAGYGRRIKPFVRDVGARLEAVMAEGGRVLFEGAQGVLLDVDHGTYPFVTSSSTVAGSASAGTGTPAHRLEAVLGVAKAYVTRVGEGPFPTELSSGRGIGRHLVEVGREVGTTTGRPRRVGWLDVVALRYAARVSGATHLAVTKLDVLDGVGSIKAATAYRIGPRTVRSMPEDPEALARARPVYEEVEGWQRARSAAGGLSRAARSYLAWVSGQVGLPVAFASTGPQRDATVPVSKGPFTVGRRAGRVVGGRRARPRRT